MKYFIVIFVSLSLLSFSGQVSAGKKSGIYIGGSVGQAGLDISSSGVNFDDDDLGFKIFAGYNFGLIPLIDIALEGSYVDFGEGSSSKILNQDVGNSPNQRFGCLA